MWWKFQDWWKVITLRKIYHSDEKDHKAHLIEDMMLTHELINHCFTTFGSIYNFHTFKLSNEISSQWWMFISIMNFDLSGNIFMIIGFHPKGRFSIKWLIVSYVMNLHQFDKFIKVMGFYRIDDFLSKWGIFIKVVDFHEFD